MTFFTNIHNILILINLFNLNLNECNEYEKIHSKNFSEFKEKNLKNSCYSINANLLENEICLDILKSIEEVAVKEQEEFQFFKDECNKTVEKIEDNNWINLNHFNNCEEKGFYRNLQIKSGFGSHIRLPSGNSALRGPSEPQNNNIFSFETQKVCTSILALHFIKVCKKLCDKESSMTVKESIFPRSCFPSCIDFSKHVCIKGCEFFECDIPFDECSYQMCNFQLQ